MAKLGSLIGAIVLAVCASALAQEKISVPADKLNIFDTDIGACDASGATVEAAAIALTWRSYKCARRDTAGPMSRACFPYASQSAFLGSTAVPGLV